MVKLNRKVVDFMEMPSYDTLLSLLKSMTSQFRFNHSVNVANMAARLAKIYGADVQKAMVAGLLHDITKDIPIEEQLEIMKKYIKPEDVKIFDRNVFHGFTGSVYAKEILNIQDEEILGAIKNHVVGSANMSTLEKILLVADLTSDDRSDEFADELRKIAMIDLNLAVFKIAIFNIEEYAFKNYDIINPYSFEAYNSIVKELDLSKLKKVE